MARYRSTGDPVLDLGILAASIVIVLLIRLGVKYWPRVIYCLAPKTKEYAKVRYVHASPYMWERKHSRGEEIDHIHVAEFELEDGRRIKMHITHEDYIMLRAGSKGYLTRKGGWFLSFEAGEKKPELEKSNGILTHEIE